MTQVLSLFSALALSLHWGLGFPEPGKPPVIDVPAEHIAQFDAYHIGNPDEKIIRVFSLGAPPSTYFL